MLAGRADLATFPLSPHSPPVPDIFYEAFVSPGLMRWRGDRPYI